MLTAIVLELLDLRQAQDTIDVESREVTG
jgi:hypothetical protein